MKRLGRVLENGFSWGEGLGRAEEQHPLRVKRIGRIVYASLGQESLFYKVTYMVTDKTDTSLSVSQQSMYQEQTCVE